MGSVEDPDFAKQNNRDPAASPLAYLPTKLVKQGLKAPHGKLPLSGREKISSRVRWCFCFI